MVRCDRRSRSRRLAVVAAMVLVLLAGLVFGGWSMLELIERPEWLGRDASWSPVQASGAPSARMAADTRAPAIWTGREMIVWGGTDEHGSPTDNGARYDPATDTWTPMSTVGAPYGRSGYSRVWTGSEMIVWGGLSRESRWYGDGARYNPETDSWTPIGLVGAPSGRSQHSVVWTGREMIVWGGFSDAGWLADGGRYDPAADSWTPISSGGAPCGRYGHSAVWTGHEMIVSGGMYPCGQYGARYDPQAGAWKPISPIGGPGGPSWQLAFWTGSEMLVWREFLQDGPLQTTFDQGWRYNSTTDAWKPFSQENAPGPRAGAAVAWTGRELIVWGAGEYPTFERSGGRYDPRHDRWQLLSNTQVLRVRIPHSVAWTGSELIIWGGWWDSPRAFMGDGARLRP